jgi:hypothetical protein
VSRYHMLRGAIEHAYGASVYKTESSSFEKNISEHHYSLPVCKVRGRLWQLGRGEMEGTGTAAMPQCQSPDPLLV